MTTDASTLDAAPENIRQRMADTRRHLVGQVRDLEDKLLGYVQDTSDAVGEAVRDVTDAVQASANAAPGQVRHAAACAVATAGYALDVHGHVRRHPWLAVGAAIALGLVCDRLVRR